MLSLAGMLVSALIVSLIFLISRSLGTALISAGQQMASDFRWTFHMTPALDVLLMFVIQAVILVSVLTYFFPSVSKHIVISLDIIFYLSAIIPIRFHRLKESPYFPCIL